MFDWFVIRPELSGTFLQGRRDRGEAFSRAGHLAVTGPGGGLRSAGRRSWAVLRGANRLYASWRNRRETIRALSRLDDRMLRDIGVDPYSLELIAAELAERQAPTPQQTYPHGGTKLDAGASPPRPDFDCAGLKHAA